jgi:precorrin-2 dehydrogenase/sirohydrochlorin ferrochelatase
VPAYFPLFVDLEGHRCLVVGGGAVGERKARALLDCGARVVVVSPVLTPALASLALAGRVEHRARTFRAGDVRGSRLVVAATGGPADRAVVAVARRRSVLVNAVDQPAWCDVIVPSVLRRGALQIAVSTGGRSPALAREIRRRLEPLFGGELGALVEEVGRERARALGRARTAAGRARAGERVARRVLAVVGERLPGDLRPGAQPPRRLRPTALKKVYEKVPSASAVR